MPSSVTVFLLADDLAAHCLEVVRPAQPARCRAAELDVVTPTGDRLNMV